MDEEKKDYIKGRGAQKNPSNHFERHHYSEDLWEGMDEEMELGSRTRYIEVFPKSIINKVTSPDVGMEYSMNPYQGCEHGCTYCYARPTHEYWGYSAGVDFERVILVKKNAAELVRTAFRKKSWKVGTLVLSGNTDCYQPAEKVFGITRNVLEVALEFRNPVGIITKNVLLQRDLDILEEMAKKELIVVNLSITTLNEDLRRVLEPRTATSKRKMELVETLSNIGVPVNVMVAPIIPALNDHELFSILKEAAARGASSAGYTIVRLNGPNQEIFTDWVTKNFPDRAQKILNQIKDIQGGQLGNSNYKVRMRGVGSYAMNLRRQMEVAKSKFFSSKKRAPLRKDLFRRPPEHGQTSLFD